MKKIPQIAILGRPNVGKSSLFNRLIGKRLSIVDDQPGVTRDRVFGMVEWEGFYFSLIDTGGLIPDPKNEIEVGVIEQIEIARNESDLIMFIVDAQVGITEEDLRIARELLRLEKPILLVVNKLDNPKNTLFLGEYYKLGLGEPLAVSAANGLFVNDLLDTIIEHLPREITDWEENNNAIPVAIVGRPNIGKSTLINRLIGKNISVVSSIPGTTRDAVHSFIQYKNQIIKLIDTAGLRRKSRIQNNIEYYSTVRSIRHVGLSEISLLLIDPEEGLTKQDLEIMDIIRKERKGMILVINKWDKLTNKTEKSFADFCKELYSNYSWLKYFPITTISALTGLRVFPLLETILTVHQRYNQQISTSYLNRIVEKISLQYPPPANKGKHIKFYFASQIAQSPPKIVITTNFPDLLKDNYTRYFETSLYENLDLNGVFFKYSFIKKESGRV